MDINRAQDQLRLKQILVDLEDKHNHLTSSVDHLEREVEKREIAIRELIADRELELAKIYPYLKNKQYLQQADQIIQSPDSLETRKTKQQAEDYSKHLDILESGPSRYSSEFTKELDKLLKSIDRDSQSIRSYVNKLA